MHFNWCTLHVSNLEASVKFYEEIAGLSIDRHYFSGPDKEIIFMGTGETKLELIYQKGQNEISMGEDISIGFEAESLEKLMELLKEKDVPITAGPIQPNPNIRFIYVKDPNGLTVQFAEHFA
ncbi:VOC family protein [Anaerocolumna sp. AGMB13020]|uniref:VOC family protein n=1 Tax=Anaerocolumna sp. AGMB13020 TaxID=3081750 RepID=UPI0029546B08|nr:VOC family protein [Anaerocolumna sp. AGMB13020]WOO38355.1 VOC family protein [Anaerocolumna sp. AGMB13020]